MGFQTRFITAVGLMCIPCMAAIAQAQVSPDGSLNTTVTQSGLNYTITNGTTAGTNLYQSFGQFSVPTGGSATFDLNATPAIRTIFGRVTGGSVSNIDGLIQTINSSNPVSLFLMNPAGIIFGPNARLNIGGSFVGTTAKSIKFADGSEFSAIAPAATPLLTVSVPIGLQMGANPGAIQVQGRGHRLVTNNVNRPIAGAGTNPSGLRVQPGNTLALVGGNVTLAGGILSAPQGRVELGAGVNGRVSLNPNAQGWTLGWEGVQTLRDIRLTGRSLLDASGAGSGNIQLTGRQVTLLDGSIALIQTSGGQTAGTLGINAAETVNISGFSPINQSNSGLISSTVAGKGAEIAIVTRQLVGTGLIRTQAFNRSTGGNLSIRAADSVQLDGALRAPTSDRNGLAALAFQSSQAGQITVTTTRLNLLNGGTITSTTSGSGNAGNVFIQAQEAINVSGFSPGTPRPSVISASSFSTGNAGAITLNTARLTLQDGAVISTSYSGNSGSITINATDAIELKGSFQQDPLLQTRISSGVFFLPQALTGSSALPTGAAGNITLNTKQLSLTSYGSVMVSNVGSGNGGTIRIQADAIALDRQSNITAATASGEGGNITLNAHNLLLLRHGSNITATAGGTGNGGNITLNAPILAGFENSDIIANAVKGRGGNIQITTQGIFGLKFRPQLTPNNDITASSQFGVSGNVQISNVGVDPTSGVVQLPVNLVDTSQQIATGCDVKGSRFVATGRGGLPANPTEQVENDRPWADIRNVSTLQQPGQPITTQRLTPKAHPPIIEASELTRNSNGEIELIALPTTNSSNFSAQATCVEAIAR
jgi:filamentous hemagglutinin family protein